MKRIPGGIARTGEGQKGRPVSDAEPLIATCWTTLAKQLEATPVLATRSCPKCNNVGTRDAAICGDCWTKLVPPA